MTTINSNRKFKVACVSSDDISVDTITLHDLIEAKDGYEWQYSLLDILDRVLDLKQYENMTFNYNRDNSNSLGIILRWQ